MSTTPEEHGDVEEASEAGEVGSTVDEAEAEQTVQVTHKPTQLSQILSLCAILIGVGVTAPFTLLALPFGIAGAVIVVGGLFAQGSRGLVSLGVGMALFGAFISGAYGAVPTGLFLVGISMIVIAWDAGQFSIDLGEQLSRETQTRNIEAAHTAFTLLALTIGGGFAYLVFMFGGTGRPAPAVALSIIGAIFVVWVYQR